MKAHNTSVLLYTWYLSYTNHYSTTLHNIYSEMLTMHEAEEQY